MRLLTHNMLQCPRTKSYPLALKATEVDDVEVEYQREFILRMLPRLDWAVLRAAAAALNVDALAEKLPEDPPTKDASDDCLRAVHAALMEWHVVEGSLQSPDGYLYKITGGIPNLIPSDTIASVDAGDQAGDEATTPVPASGVAASVGDDMDTTGAL